MANHRMTLISLFAIGFAGINVLALPVSAEMYVAGTAGACGWAGVCSSAEEAMQQSEQNESSNKPLREIFTGLVSL